MALYYQQALATLDRYPQSSYRQSLRNLVQFTIERQS
jgi:geranylgeranyl pyrophosphate synthase